MAAALAANTTVPEACAMLDAQASGKPRLIWLALANALLVGATVGISIALPDADRLTPMAQAPAAVPATTVASSPISVAIAPEVSASAVPVAAASAPAAEIAVVAPPPMANHIGLSGPNDCYTHGCRAASAGCQCPNTQNNNDCNFPCCDKRPPDTSPIYGHNLFHSAISEWAGYARCAHVPGITADRR